MSGSTESSGGTMPTVGRWYVVHTYSGYEAKVKASLDERRRAETAKKQADLVSLEASETPSDRELANIADLKVALEQLESFQDVLVPAEKVVELVKGQRRTSTRKFFPGYILVNVGILGDFIKGFIKSTPRVTGFVGSCHQEIGSTPQSVIEQADIVCLATTAAEPILDGDWFKPGAHINAIGSHTPAVRELDTKSLLRAKVVCDTKVACLNEAGDIQIPIEAGGYSADQIHGDLGEVVNGTIAGRESDDEVTLFKSVGLAVQDISCAGLVYRKATEQGVGQEFNFPG